MTMKHIVRNDEEEQNILYFNDIFPFNIICPDDLKSGKDKNDNDVDIIHSSEGNEITHRTNMLMDTSCDKIDKIFNEESFVLELNVNIAKERYLYFDKSLEKLVSKKGYGVLGINLYGIWRGIADFNAPCTIHYSFGGARYWSESERMIPRKGDLHDYWRDISTDGDFLGPPPSYTLIKDLVLRLCHRMLAHSTTGRKSEAYISGDR
ncbi:hypothetical protein Tco_0930055 [Tanacetum coccineum]